MTDSDLQPESPAVTTPAAGDGPVPATAEQAAPVAQEVSQSALEPTPPALPELSEAKMEPVAEPAIISSPTPTASPYTEPAAGDMPQLSPARVEPVESVLPEMPKLTTDPVLAAMPEFSQPRTEPAETVMASPHEVMVHTPPVEAVVQTPPAERPVAPNMVPFDPVFDIAAIEIEHARWLTSEGKEGQRANFRGLDLSGLDMSGRHFMEASLRGTILRGANLSGTDLRAADLTEAVLDGANLRGTLLAGAALVRAQLHQVQAIGADMVTANFTAAIADGINLNGAKMNGAILRNANFRAADFTHAMLRDVNLRGATLVQANLSAADLTGADCRDVNFDHARFPAAILDKANFRDAKLGDIDFRDTNFSGAIDVANEFQAQSLQSERSKIDEDQAQLALRTRTVEEEKKRIDTLLEEREVEQVLLARKLKKLSLGFTIRFVLWLVLAALVAVFTLIRADEIDITRVIGVLIGAGLVVLLALFSMLRSVHVARLIRQFAAARPQIIEVTKEESLPSLPSVPSESKLSTPPPKVASKRISVGFSLRKKK